MGNWDKFEEYSGLERLLRVRTKIAEGKEIDEDIFQEYPCLASREKRIRSWYLAAIEDIQSKQKVREPRNQKTQPPVPVVTTTNSNRGMSAKAKVAGLAYTVISYPHCKPVSASDKDKEKSLDEESSGDDESKSTPKIVGV